ncbi:hypothetical protein K443DRAFT_347731 [Laccaria amethystina LaAM-08-1]|jgi:hypothetical protein|uniref:Uncharacterized protein n=1 Tax=Laccaria amethystina LaAM-08-1 TaxID=1095629 RepID=A0A0C9X0P4_9AGAR|nr:hypothetical protein K443DRAFT_347731 [Laccaria amethystina LaAM-08-1]
MGAERLGGKTNRLGDDLKDSWFVCQVESIGVASNTRSARNGCSGNRGPEFATVKLMMWLAPRISRSVRAQQRKQPVDADLLRLRYGLSD